LTEDGLDLQCVLPIVHSYDTANNFQQIQFGSETTDVKDLNWRDEEAHSMIIVCMAGKKEIKNRLKYK
jgi:hypothetical protein